MSNKPTDVENLTAEAIELAKDSTNVTADDPSSTKRHFRRDILDLYLTGWIDTASTDMAAKLEYKAPVLGMITLLDEVKGSLKEGFGSKFEREEVQGEIRFFLKPGNKIWIHVVLNGSAVKDKVDEEKKLFCKTVDDLRK